MMLMTIMLMMIMSIKKNEYYDNDYCDVCAMWDPISDDNLSSLDPSTADQTNQKT